MSYLSTTISGVWLAGGVILAAGVDYALPERFTVDPPFMTVQAIEQEGPNVVAVRTVENEVIADWVVVLTLDGSVIPICQGQGSSLYQLGKYERIMDYDFWANDPGCWDRLEDGQSVDEFVSWVPRGKGGYVQHKRSFVVEKKR